MNDVRQAALDRLPLPYSEASHPGTSFSSVTNLFVDEALRCQVHRGVTFRPGPTGRRAGLVGGPDIWEVIDTVLTLREHDSGLSGDALVTATAEAIGLSERKVRVAIGDYAGYRDEIDASIEDNRRATREAEARR